jgi:hypothetical protein
MPKVQFVVAGCAVALAALTLVLTTRPGALAQAQGGGSFSGVQGSLPGLNNIVWRVDNQNGRVSFCTSGINDLSKAPKCSPWGAE